MHPLTGVGDAQQPAVNILELADLGELQRSIDLERVIQRALDQWPGRLRPDEQRIVLTQIGQEAHANIVGSYVQGCLGLRQRLNCRAESGTVRASEWPDGIIATTDLPGVLKITRERAGRAQASLAGGDLE